MKKFLLVAAAAISFASPAVASEDDFISPTGQTTFQDPLVTVCYRNGEVIRYNTIYNGIPYEGYLWVKDLAGCRTPKVYLQGYFEERNDSRNQWCKGNLTLQFNGSRGMARWQNISAQPGYRCSGSGQPFSLPLVQAIPTGL